jgi:ATP-binding cassette, subfamily C (CFTR/MRP), member 1
MSSILVPFLRTIPSRAVRIALNYSQAFLITAAVEFLERPVSQRDVNDAYGLIGATALIYIAIAVSSQR